MARLADLVDPLAQSRVGSAITAAVSISFREDGSTPTQDEIKRRANICIDHVGILRNELGWPIAKICDLLPQSLRAELDSGGPANFFASMGQRGWFAPDGTAVRTRTELRTAAGLIVPSGGD